MAVFSVNQVRQLYVVKGVKSGSKADEQDKGINGTLAREGDITINETKDGDVYFSYLGYNKEALRSDLITKGNVLWVNAATAASMQTKLRYATVTLDPEVNGGDPISGQDYLLRVIINPFLGMSDDEPYIKYGMVHAYRGMTTSKFYATLALSLAKNFSREIKEMFKFYLTTSSDDVPVTADTKESDLDGIYTGVKIEEVEQKGNDITKAADRLNFVIQPDMVIDEGDERLWAVIDPKTGMVPVTEGDTIIGNGKKIADLEYFCLGERGDIYRGMGWPNYVKTNYMVDPTATYDVIDIHFAFVGDGISAQRSEKDITLVAPVSVRTQTNYLIAGINAKLGTNISTLS